MKGTLTLVKSEPFRMRYTTEPERLTDEEFFQFCRENADWRIERTAEGDLIIMPPAGGETGSRNSQMNRLLGNWAEADGTGIVFDSSTGFTLPSGAVRAPDAAWARRDRWEALTPEQRRKFPPLCPDFIVELRSPSDALAALQEKMAEYLTNGAQLGWLIDPEARNVYVYRPDAEIVCLESPDQIAGDPILPGFVLDLNRIWA